MAPILVLGGDGYLGWPLALTLALRHAQTRVVIVDNLARRQQVAEVGGQSITPIASPSQRLAAYRRFSGRKNLEFVQLDIASDGLDPLIAELQPQIIYHLAQQASAPYSMMDVDRAVHTIVNNETGNMRLLWAVRRHIPTAHVVKLGSFGEYAQCGLEIPEGYFCPTHAGKQAERLVPFPRESDDIYHISKINDTNYISLACRKWNLRVTDVMQCTAFGAATQATAGSGELDSRLDHDAVFGTVVNRFAAQVAAGTAMTIYGTGHQRTGLMALGDAIDALARLVDDPAAPGQHRVINNVTVADLSINEIAATMANVAAARGLPASISRLHNPRQEAPTSKPKHTIRADYVAKHVRAGSFAAELDRLLAVVLRHRSRILPATFPPRVTW